MLEDGKRQAGESIANDLNGLCLGGLLPVTSDFDAL